jgi:predicted dehydrogenase
VTAGLRVGVAGTGFIGRVHARSALLAGAVIVGVSGSSPQRASDAARAWGADQWFSSSDELVRADDVDVVHICTPNHLHHPLALAALRAGKHVVCEKPLAIEPKQAAELVEAAGTAGTVATVPFVYRFYPMIREARARAAAGDLGDVRLLHGSYLQDWLLTDDDDNWRIDPELGGRSRAFADIGSHWCDLVEFVSGHRIVRLAARSLIAVPERTRSVHRHSFVGAAADGDRRTVTTEDVATMLFETDRGALGSVVVSQVSPGRKNRLWFEVDGSVAAIVFDQERPEEAWLARRHGVAKLVRDPLALSPDAARYSALPAGHPQGYQECFDAFVADTYAAIHGDATEGLPTFRDGLRATEITAAVLESATDGGWVEVAR